MTQVKSELNMVEWRDLTKLSTGRVIYEICLPVPFLVLSLYAIEAQHIMLALVAAFFFFLTGLRLSHNAQHNMVGCSKQLCECILFTLSVLMMNSMHAVKVSHLRHHKYCLRDEDEEGSCAHMPFYQALFYGPLFTLRMHRDALKYGSKKQRRWIYSEVLMEAMLLIYCFTLAPLTVQIFVFAMLGANCLTAFFCVWLVHYGCDGIEKISRTVRSHWLNKVSFHMFLHVEHHLFPQVPTCNLLKLARRIDEQNDSFKNNLVFARGSK